MTRDGGELWKRRTSCDPCVSALGLEGMGRGAVCVSGGTPDGRPGGNGGGGPGCSSIGLSGLSSGLRGGNGDGEGGWGGGIGVGVSAVIVGFGACWTGGIDREVGGGGGGTVKGGDTGTLADSTSALSSGALSSGTSSFSSGFRSLSEGNGMDCDQ